MGKKLGTAGALIYALAAAISVVGLIIGQIIGYMALSEHGAPDAKQLATGVYLGLSSQLYMIPVAIIGAIMAYIAFKRFDFEERWFFWTLVAASIGLIPSIIGLVMLFWLIIRKDHFLKKKVAHA